MFKAEILADSLSPQGDRLTTMKITFPRIVLAEFNTHRMFSRNSASSRAIPFNKMVKMVEENPFIPIAWMKDHKGMQGTEYITNPLDIIDCNHAWEGARDYALQQSKRLGEKGVTKQLCNRLLEPFMWTTMLITGSKEGWDNFFELRCPQYLYDYEDEAIYFKSKKDWVNYYNESQGYKEKNKEFTKVENLTDLEWLQINKGQAEIHIMDLAEKIYDAMNESTPKELQAGEWHIPMGNNIDSTSYSYKQTWDKDNDVKSSSIQLNNIKIATARCARISYETLGDNPKIDYEADIKLHDTLVKNGHASPLEHCARAMNTAEYNGAVSRLLDSNGKLIKDERGWCKNFKGFIQYRAILDI